MRPPFAQLPTPKLDLLTFAGGLDETTPIWSVPTGCVRQAQNFEIGITGGYADVAGYERYDGHAAPSDATYRILNYNLTGTPIAVGDTVTGATSGATGVVIAIESGTPIPLILTRITGVFQNAENLQVSAVTRGTASGTAGGSAATPALHATYLALAADSYRTLIAKPAGSGPVRGVWVLNDVRYCVRNNAGGTAAVFYKATASGWQVVDLGYYMTFSSGGTYVLQDGDTLTGATSGATAVLRRAVVTSGSYAAGTAAGYLITNTPVGTWVGENINVGGNLNVATMDPNQQAIVLQPNGRYEVVTDNVQGFGFSKRIYGCDGANLGFEFDGTAYVPVFTGMSVDKPTHVAVHKNKLFFSFGPSVQHSADGDPFVWAPVLGAAELNVGDSVTAFQVEPGSTGDASLGIYCRNRLSMLYGNSTADWNLVKYRDEVGAYPYTCQNIGFTLFLDDRGINSLKTAQEFGNFNHATLSERVQKFLSGHRGNAACSMAAHDKNQYRLYFSDGYGLYTTLSKKGILGIMPIVFPHAFNVSWSGELANGSEVQYVGTADGYVMQLERGTSFDGANIVAFLIFPPYFLRSIGYEKTFKGATAEVAGSGYASFKFGYQLNYNDGETAQPNPVDTALSLAPGQWDAAINWDTGFWDASTNKPVYFRVTGTSESIAYTLSKDSNAFSPVLFTGIRTRHIVRRQVRHR